MRPTRRTPGLLLASLALGACLPATESGVPLPRVEGAYPAAAEPASRRSAAWSPVEGTRAGLRIDALADGFFHALPDRSAQVDARGWPDGLRVESAGVGGARLLGAWSSAAPLASEVRCDGGSAQVRVAAEVLEVDGSLRTEVYFEADDHGPCEISRRGQHRLHGIAMDVHRWAREIARAGTPLLPKGW